MNIRTTPTLEQTARGYRAEARFFEKVGTHYGKHRPWWFVRIERAPAYMDHRGYDGYAFISQYLIFVQRIPLQIRTREVDMDYTIRPDKPVFVLTHVDMKPERMMYNLIKRLELAWRHDFEPQTKAAEMKPIEAWEQFNIATIEQNRKLYK